jgi:hypothetical protein
LLGTPPTVRAGQCQCGHIRFEFEGEPSDASFCYCSICQKLSGSAFAAYIEVATSDLRITQGKDQASSYNVTTCLKKKFCGTCGTPLFTEHASFPEFTYISLGVMNDHQGIVPQYHQFVGSKVKWYEISDDLPQFEQWPD